MDITTFKPTPLEDILGPRPPRKAGPTPWRGRPGEAEPLWSILGEAPPYDWQPPAPNQVSTPETPPRVPATGAPTLAVTAHNILGFGPLHSALQSTFVPEQFEWFSAGPDAGRLVSEMGSTSGDPSVRGSDHPDKNFVLGTITPPPGVGAAGYWDMLKSLDARYGDNVDYDLFPEIQNSYNSNSYARGLLEAGGGSTTAPFDQLVGGASPLPPDHFASPHLWGTGFPHSPQPQPAPTFRRRF